MQIARLRRAPQAPLDSVVRAAVGWLTARARCGRSALHRPPAHRPTSWARVACAGSAPGCRSIASAAPISRPPFRKNRPPRSRTSSPACGTISAGSPASSPISTGCMHRRSEHPARGRHRRTIRISDDRFHRLRDDGKPALVLHRPSRQLGAPGACGGAASGSIRRCSYRPPNIRAISDAILEDPRRLHGHAGRHRPRRAGPARACARARPPCRHAGRPILRARGRRDLLRPHLQGQSAARAARPPLRMPDPRRARGAAARTGITSAVE